MLKSDLLEIIANGENSGVEFKRDDLRPEQLAKEIVALANLQGGVILIGVEDEGTISGIQRHDLETWVMDTVITHYVHPYISILFSHRSSIGDPTLPLELFI
jgi:ATP-dependent DNA helicase RecG